MNKQNDCQKRREAITAFALGELEHRAADELKKHIDTCETCRFLYHALVDEEETIRSAFQAIADRSETLQNSLVKQLDKHDLPVPQIYIRSRKTTPAKNIFQRADGSLNQPHITRSSNAPY